MVEIESLLRGQKKGEERKHKKALALANDDDAA